MTQIYLLAFLTGLCFGSFASVIIYRLHSGQKGLLMGRSKCPKCKHILGPKDLIPVFSFLFSRFKCQHCRKPISFIYPLLELTMGLSFLITTYWVGIESAWKLPYFLFLTFIFVTISFYDILFQEIPDSLSLPTIILAGLAGVFGHLHTLNSLGIGFAIPVAFFGALFLGSRGRWLGGGDIRIGAIMGFVLGWPKILVGLFLAYCIGSVFSAVGLATKRIHLKSAIPFGPFLFLGTYIAMIWGDRILNWYLRLI
jgi:prepilin signal peptidase PulO-like enzyme (type II secretory pathway)